MSMFKRHPLGIALFGAALVLAAAQGCGGDNSNDNPKPPDVGTSGSNPTGGKPGTAGSDNKGGKAGNGNNPEGGTAPVTNGGTGNNPEGGNGNEAGGDNPPIPACTLPELGKDKCFNCPKDGQIAQWLNRCSDSDCVPFKNARLPQLKADGSRPALPN